MDSATLETTILQEIDAKKNEINRQDQELKQILINKIETQQKLADLYSELNGVCSEICKLPPELLRLIFKKLSTIRLMRCRLVCRRFLHASEGILLGCLIIFNRKQEERGSSEKGWMRGWKKHAKRAGISVIRVSRFRNFKLEKHLNSFSVASTIRRLMLETVDDSLGSKFINYFKRLNELEIRRSRCPLTIDLAELESLVFKNAWQKVLLNTPKLTKFESDRSLSRFSFTYPERTEHLILPDPWHSYPKELLNVKRIAFFDTFLVDSRDLAVIRNMLIELPNLEEIDFVLESFVLEHTKRKSPREPQGRMILSSILGQRKQLERETPRLKCFGVDIEDRRRT